MKSYKMNEEHDIILESFGSSFLSFTCIVYNRELIKSFLLWSGYALTDKET